MFNNPKNTNGIVKAPNIKQLLPAIEWMADQIPGGFFIYKAYDDLELLYVNRALMRIFACKTLDEFKELTGFTFKGIVHPEDFDEIQSNIDNQIEDPSNENLDYVEYRIIRKDGEVRWIDDYGYLAELPGYGKVYFVFVVDITDKHNVREETLRRADIFKGMVDQFNALADNSLTVIRMNITKTWPFPVELGQRYSRSLSSYASTVHCGISQPEDRYSFLARQLRCLCIH